jgi:hypothetical protein
MKIPVLLLIPVAALFSQNRSDYGSLKITSDPAGHTVYCNGRDVGRTPVVVDSVAAGRCLVQIQDPRFESWWVEARIEPDTVNLIHAILVPVTGSVHGPGFHPQNPLGKTQPDRPDRKRRSVARNPFRSYGETGFQV